MPATPLTSKYQSMAYTSVIVPVSWKFHFDSDEPGPAAINTTNAFVRGLSDSPNIGLPMVMLARVDETFDTTTWGASDNTDDWGDGTTYDNHKKQHTYTTPGFYTTTSKDVSGNVLSQRFVVAIWRSYAVSGGDTNIWHHPFPLQISNNEGAIDGIYSFTATLQLSTLQYSIADIGLIPEGSMIAVFGEARADGAGIPEIPITGICGGFASKPHYHRQKGNEYVSWTVQGICGILQRLQTPEFTFMDPGVMCLLGVCLNSDYRVNGQSPIFGDPLSIGMPLNHFEKVSVTQVWAHVTCHIRVSYTANSLLSIPASPTNIVGTRPSVTNAYFNIGQVCKLQFPQNWDEFDNAAQFHSFTWPAGDYITSSRNFLGNEGWLGPFDTRFFTFRTVRESFFEVTQEPELLQANFDDLQTELDIYIGDPVDIKCVIVQMPLLMSPVTSTYNTSVTDPDGNVIIYPRDLSSTLQNLSNPSFDNYASQALTQAKTAGQSGIENLSKDPNNISVDVNAYQKCYPTTPNPTGNVVGPLPSVFCSDALAFAQGMYNKLHARIQVEATLINRPGLEIGDGVRFIGSDTVLGINWPSPGKLFKIHEMRPVVVDNTVLIQKLVCLEADPFEYA